MLLDPPSKPVSDGNPQLSSTNFKIELNVESVIYVTRNGIRRYHDCWYPKAILNDGIRASWRESVIVETAPVIPGEYNCCTCPFVLVAHYRIDLRYSPVLTFTDAIGWMVTGLTRLYKPTDLR